MSEFKKANLWWRWLLMPIAALLSASVVSILVALAILVGLKLFGTGEPDGWSLYLVTGASRGAFGYVLALVAYSVSPSRKLAAGYVAIFLMVTFFVAAVLAPVAPSIHSLRVIGFVAGAPTAIALAAVALFQAHKGLLERAPSEPRP